jgi:hypothetical protein
VPSSSNSSPKKISASSPSRMHSAHLSTPTRSSLLQREAANIVRPQRSFRPHRISRVHEFPARITRVLPYPPLPRPLPQHNPTIVYHCSLRMPRKLTVAEEYGRRNHAVTSSPPCLPRVCLFFPALAYRPRSIAKAKPSGQHQDILYCGQALRPKGKCRGLGVHSETMMPGECLQLFPVQISRPISPPLARGLRRRSVFSCR